MAESCRAIGLAVWFGAIASHVEIPVGELRRLDALQNPGVNGDPWIVGGPCAGTGESGSGKGCEGMAACIGGHLNRWYGPAPRASRRESFSGSKDTVSEFKVRY